MNDRRSAPNRLRFPFVPFLIALGLVLSGFGGCVLNTHGTGKTDAGAGGAQTACNDAVDCDDNEPCTVDKCGSDSLCTHTAVDDGPADNALQTAGDCKTVVCKAGKASDDPDDNDIFDDGKDCTIDGCAMGKVLNTAKVAGTMCDNNGSTGRCSAQGECQVTCTTAADCEKDNTNPCVVPACDTENSICLFPPVSDGTPTPGQPDVPGDCNIHVCVGGMDTALPDDSDVPISPTDCDQEICTNGVPSNPALAVDTVCNTFNGGSPGHCDDAGTCRECAVNSQCGGAIDDCKFHACINFSCTIDFNPAGTPTSGNPAQVAGDCHELRCDGAGGVTNAVKDQDVPIDGDICHDDVCTNGTPSNPPHPGLQCGTIAGQPTFCNAQGQCGCQQDADCTAPATCGGGNPGTALVCGCTKLTCATAGGLTCGSVPDGCGGTLNCNNGAQNGGETDVDCGGGGQCSLKCGQGKKCNGNSDCSNNTCVDGFCCNNACSGTCQACSAAKTGGANGVCNSIIPGTDPDTECSDQGPTSCGTTGLCGSGACAFYPSTTVCQAASCADASTQNKQKNCNGTGTCVTPTPATQGCAPYLCSGTSCTSSCSNDGQCATGNYCGGGVCQPQLAVGGACTTSNQCLMGNCVDGFCCNNACNSACQACSAAKKQSNAGNGTCGSAKNSVVDPRALCGTSPPCGNTGLCQAGACEKTAMGTNCGASSCTGSTLTPPRTCDGTGTCTMVSTMACANNLKCNGAMTSCLGNCAGNDNNCVNGFFCNGANACVAKIATGSAGCSSDNQCVNGHCGLTNNTCCAVDCPDQGAMTCGTSGSCAAGTGACEKYDATTGCNATSCSGSSLTTFSLCNGNGVCNTGGSSAACGNNLTCLNATSCRSNCAGSDANCINNYYCDGANACQPEKGNGVTCGGDHECSSNDCDVNCCATTCVSTGTCKALSCMGGTGDCVYPVGINCGSTCNTSNNKVTNSTCDSNGGCVVGSPTDCPTNLKCQNTTQCWANCLTAGMPDDAKCVPGKTCLAGGTCTP